VFPGVALGMLLWTLYAPDTNPRLGLIALVIAVFFGSLCLSLGKEASVSRCLTRILLKHPNPRKSAETQFYG